MHKKIILSLIIITIIFLNCAVGPQLSPMQIRQMTTKLISGSYEDSYRASLTVLQDQGYIIKNTDMASGLIVANVDRASDAGSQFAQALFLGYVADKGTEVEVSCMVNKLSNTNTEIRLNIQETNYGQSSKWSGYSKQNARQIYDPDLYHKIFNDIELEVKRRQAIMGMSDQNVTASSQGAIIPSEESKIDYDTAFDELVNEDNAQYFNIVKIVKNFCLITTDKIDLFKIGATYSIIRQESSNNENVGKAKVVKIKDNNIALQIIEGQIKVNDKIKCE